MRKITKVLLVITCLVSFWPSTGAAADSFERAKVLRVIEEAVVKVDNDDSYFQKLEIETNDGLKHIIEQGKNSVLTKINQLQTGDQIIVYQGTEENSGYQVADRWRLNSFLFIFIFFLIIVLLVVGYRGLLAVVGLLYSLLIIFVVMVPMLLAGYSPVLTTLMSGLIIVVPTMFFTHGFNRRSVLISASIIGGLTAALILNIVFTAWANLSGGGSEEVYYLQIAGFTNVDFKALFMGGVIIGVLGVLDDVTVGQIGVVDELREVNQKISNSELILRALRIGKSHVLSLVNTLALAYIGAGLPLFMLFVGDKTMPWWVLLNSEGVGEEIIRTLVGSSALVLTVPIATFLAVWFKEKNNPHH